MKKTGYSIFLILVSITSFACLRKEITNAQQNNVANIESNNKSTKNTIEKVENLEGIFIRNNPMAQWNIFKSDEQIYGVGKIPNELLEKYNEYSEDGSIVRISGEIHSDELGPGKNIYPKTIDLINKGDVIPIETELNGTFNKSGKLVIDNKEYEIAISNYAPLKNYESLIMEYIEKGKEVKITGKFILGKSRIVITDIK